MYKLIIFLLIFCMAFSSQSQIDLLVTENNEVLVKENEAISYSDQNQKWERPSYWPIGTGYTVNAWLTPENKKIKMVIKCDGLEAVNGSAVRGFVDWYADGSNISNFNASLASYTNSFVYPPSDIGKYIPVTITITNTTTITLAWNKDINPMIGYGDRNSSIVELIYPSNVNFNVAYNIEPMYVIGNSSFAGTVAYNNIGWLTGFEHYNGIYNAYSFMGSYGKGMEVITFTNATVAVGPYLGFGIFNGCTWTKEIYLPNITNTYPSDSVSPVASCTRLIKVSWPRMRWLASNSIFKSLPNFSDPGQMPLLEKVGTELFYNSNLSFNAMTNFALGLTIDVSANPQTIDFRLNPGSAAFATWYTGGGSALIKPGWGFLY